MHLSYERQRLAVVGMLLLWCTALIFFGLHLAPDDVGVGLFWNLFLAAVPLVWSAAFQAACSKNHHVRAVVFFSLWLLFFPNAPYILTDLIHLRPLPHLPLWYTLAILLSCAGTGTMLGYFSLVNIHNTIDRKLGAVAGWVVASGSLLLSGFGIYVGRFLRWNSWNAFSEPLNLFKDVAGRIADPGVHPYPLAVTLVFGIGLFIGYLAVRVAGVSTPAK